MPIFLASGGQYEVVNEDSASTDLESDS